MNKVANPQTPNSISYRRSFAEPEIIVIANLNALKLRLIRMSDS